MSKSTQSQKLTADIKDAKIIADVLKGKNNTPEALKRVEIYLGGLDLTSEGGKERLRKHLEKVPGFGKPQRKEDRKSEAEAKANHANDVNPIPATATPKPKATTEVKKVRIGRKMHEVITIETVAKTVKDLAKAVEDGLPLLDVKTDARLMEVEVNIAEQKIAWMATKEQKRKYWCHFDNANKWLRTVKV